MIEVVFLGTGPAWPGPGRGNASLLVRGDCSPILVDCGPTTPYALTELGVEWASVKTIFLTHKHGDHTLGLPLFLARQLLARPEVVLPLVVGGASTLGLMREITPRIFPELNSESARMRWLMVREDAEDEHEVEPGVILRTALMDHPPGVPTLGLRLNFMPSGKSLVYSADTSPSERLVALAHGADLLIHEANFSETLDPDVDYVFYSHSSARKAGEIARRAECDRLALIHLSSRYDGMEAAVKAEAEAAFGKSIMIPMDGTILTL